MIYRNNTFMLKIENKVKEIPQSVGVCQGDNMAPVLFVFLMTAFAQTLDLEWTKLDIPVLSVMIAGDEHLADGKICSHTPKMSKSKNSLHMKYYNASTLMTAPSHVVQKRTCNAEWN